MRSPGRRFSLGDGSADRSSHLFVQQRGVAPIEPFEAEICVDGCFSGGLERTNENNYSSFNADHHRIRDTPPNQPRRHRHAHLFEAIKLLFKEAKLRERRRRLRWLSFFVAVIVTAGVASGIAYATTNSSGNNGHGSPAALAAGSDAKVLTCQGSDVTPSSNVHRHVRGRVHAADRHALDHVDLGERHRARPPLP